MREGVTARGRGRSSIYDFMDISRQPIVSFFGGSFWFAAAARRWPSRLFWISRARELLGVFGSCLVLRSNLYPRFS